MAYYRDRVEIDLVVRHIGKRSNDENSAYRLDPETLKEEVLREKKWNKITLREALEQLIKFVL